MTELSGTYDCTIKSPVGEQKTEFTIEVSGTEFTGMLTGPIGEVPVLNGKVSGNQLTWEMNLTKPMSMTLNCTATVEDGMLNAKLKAKIMLTIDMVGKRRA
jgi:hypothetical protein